MTKTGEGSAEYKVDGPGWREPQVFSSVGTKVPDLVRRILNMDTVNMQDQLDQPYLVVGSKGDISRAVNRVIEAEVADKWLMELNSRDTRNRQTIKALEAVIDQQQTNANLLAPVLTAEEFIVQAELADTRLTVAYNRAQGIEQLLDSLKQAEAVVTGLANVVGPLEQMVNMAEAVQAEIGAAVAQLVAIDGWWRSEQAVNELAGQYQRVVAEYVQLLEQLGQCPTCLSPVDEQMIAQLKEEL
jgi:hypothetical protein